MDRRRLLTLLASSMLLLGSFAGPAAASDLLAPVGDAPLDVAETVTAVEDAVIDVVDAVAPAVPLEDVLDVVEAAPVFEGIAPTGNTEERSEPSAPAPDAAPATGSDDTVVAAGNVTSAPPIDLLIGLGGSEPTAGRSSAAPFAPPSTAPVAATTDEVLAPEVAPAPAPAPSSAAAAPSVLAQALHDLPEESAPALALIALAALVAAGAGTAQTARLEAAR